MDNYTTNITGQAAAAPDHESASKMSEMSEPAAAAGMKVDNVTVRQAKNGGYIVTCNKSEIKPKSDAPGRYESNDYAFSTLQEAIDFLAREFGEAPATAPAPAGPEMPTDEALA